MKKKFILTFGLAVTLLSGCASSPQDTANNNQNNQQNQQQNVNTNGATNTYNKDTALDKKSNYHLHDIGGISIGEDFSEVEKVLGTNYKETLHEEPGHFNEPWYIREYDGIWVIVGKNSGKVFELETDSPKYATNLDIKVGDPHKAVLEKYGSKYQVLESRHGDGPLEGFYELEDGLVIIFDYNKDDDFLFNTDVSADSKVEKIRLTTSSFLD